MSQRIDKDDDKIRTASNDFGGSTPSRSTNMAGTGTTGGSGGSSSTSLSTTGGSGSTSAAGSSQGLAAQAQEYKQKATDVANQAKDFVTEKVKGLQNTDYQKVAEDARDYARQNPGQALLVSAAAGFLLGVLIRGSRR